MDFVLDFNGFITLLKLPEKIAIDDIGFGAVYSEYRQAKKMQGMQPN